MHYDTSDRLIADAAVINNNYFEFTITPNPGKSINFTSLSFDARRNSFGAGTGYVARSSLDGFAANLTSADIAANPPLADHVTVSLADEVFQGVEEAVTFRIYSYGLSDGVIYDNVSINGVIVPEPGSFALLGLAGGALLRRRRAAA